MFFNRLDIQKDPPAFAINFVSGCYYTRPAHRSPPDEQPTNRWSFPKGFDEYLLCPRNSVFLQTFILLLWFQTLIPNGHFYGSIKGIRQFRVPNVPSRGK